MASSDKTNAMRLFDAAHISYKEHFYSPDVAISGTEVAEALGEDCKHVFKTLVTTGKTGNHYVFMIPVAEELDLKKAASTVGEKYIEMLKSKDLLGLTGYIHGGCSPVGMKKTFRTVVHNTADSFDTILFSGGKIGFQIEVGYCELAKIVKTELSDIIK